MDIEKQLEKFDKAFHFFNLSIERILLLIASAFGAWLSWNVLGAFEVSLMPRLGGAVLGALMGAIAMWLFGLVARFIP